MVLASLPSTRRGHAGASASCARLFEVTVRGLREEAQADPSAAPLIRLADAAYDAQHPVAGDPDRLTAALERLCFPAVIITDEERADLDRALQRFCFPAVNSRSRTPPASLKHRPAGRSSA